MDITEIISHLTTTEASVETVLADVRVKNFSQLSTDFFEETRMAIRRLVLAIDQMVREIRLDPNKAREFRCRLQRSHHSLEQVAQQYYGQMAVC